MGDRGVDFGDPAAVMGLKAKPAMVAAASWRPSRSRHGREGSQNGPQIGGVTRVVVIADRHSEVFERGQRVAVFGFESGQSGRQMGLVVAVAAVLGDRQAPAQGITRAVGIGVAEGEAVSEQRVRERNWVAGGFGGVDQTFAAAIASSREPAIVSAMDQACPGESVSVATACELGAAPLDRPFGLADGQIRPPSKPSMPNGTSSGRCAITSWPASL